MPLRKSHKCTLITREESHKQIHNRRFALTRGRKRERAQSKSQRRKMKCPFGFPLFFPYVFHKSHMPDPKYFAQPHFTLFQVRTRFHALMHSPHSQQNCHHTPFVLSKCQTHLFTSSQISRLIITPRYTYCTFFEITILQNPYPLNLPTPHFFL